jgi:hypothetical protein
MAQRQAELNAAEARELEAQDNLSRVSGLTEEGVTVHSPLEKEKEMSNCQEEKEEN